MNNNFLGVEQAPLGRARFIILPLPYDVTTSYIKGTARGPTAILKASAQVETFDETLQNDTASKVQIHTLGTPKLNFRDRPEKFIPALERYTKLLLKGLSKEQILISLGGEHSISYPLVKAHKEIRSADISVLHLDAHSDLRDSYNSSIYSHACVMKQIYDSKVKNIVQVGIRNLTEACLKLIRRYESCAMGHALKHKTQDVGYPTLKTYFAHTQPDYKKLGKTILNTLSDSVYVTIDLDVFDPSMMPGVGTPEPGGLDWYEVLNILKPVFTQKQVVGFDVVELCPVKGNIISDFTAAKLIYRLMGYLASVR